MGLLEMLAALMGQGEQGIKTTAHKTDEDVIRDNRENCLPHNWDILTEITEQVPRKTLTAIMLGTASDPEPWIRQALKNPTVLKVFGMCISTALLEVYTRRLEAEVAGWKGENESPTDLPPVPECHRRVFVHITENDIQGHVQTSTHDDLLGHCIARAAGEDICSGGYGNDIRWAKDHSYACRHTDLTLQIREHLNNGEQSQVQPCSFYLDLKEPAYRADNPEDTNVDVPSNQSR